jgi:hypothetical protein
MKTQNTLENKAKFFAQYFGQEIAEITKGSYTKKLGSIKVIDYDILKSVGLERMLKIKYSLKLKPLSKISDEDAIEVARILHGEEGDFKIVYNADSLTSVSAFGRPCYAETIDIFWIGDLRYETADSIKILNAYDYLRSKGYAIPWLDLSVKDLIEYGWIKLEE